jgi:ABC-type transport system substrate-binding protein
VTDQAERSKQAWTAFAADPSGTGPFKAAKFVPRERLEMVKNPLLGRQAPPKIDRVVLLPLPEANSRTAALMSGQVDWIEGPRRAGHSAARLQVYSNLQPHIWPWQFSFLPGSPWTDKRVRQAANLCVNRTA